MKTIILNLKQAQRNMRRNAWQTTFSLLGLVLGLVCLTYSVNWLWNETHHDNFRVGYKQLYKLRTYYYKDSVFTADEGPEYNMSMSWPMTQYVMSRLPKEADACVMSKLFGVKLTAADGTILVPEELQAVDASFARMAGLHNLAGNAEEALSRPGQMVITRKDAERFFGSVEKALNAQVYAQGNSECMPGEHTFTVGAVVEDVPPTTNLPCNVLVGLFNGVTVKTETIDEWGRNRYEMMVRTRDYETLQQTFFRLTDIPMLASCMVASVRLLPLRLAHMDGKVDFRKLIYPLAFCLLSGLLLVSAFFNYLALLTTLFLGRLRQYALRVSMGASFGQCAVWLYIEVIVMILLCGLCTEVAMEWINYLADIPEASLGVYRTLNLVLPAFCLLMVLGAMFPVLRMRRLYQSRLGTGMQRLGVSRTLLVVQMAVCCLMLFVLATAYRQMYGLFTADLGFCTQNILRLERLRNDPRLDVMDLHAMDIERKLCDASSPAVTDALAMHEDIFENSYTMLTSGRQLGVTETPYSERFVRLLPLPVKACRFFGLKMTEGSWFCNENPTGMELVFNPMALDMLNLHDYATRRLTATEDGIPISISVKGITSFRTHALHRAQEPLAIVREPDEARKQATEQYDCMSIYVKHHPGMEAEARKAIRQTLEAYGVPTDLVPVERFSDYVNRNYSEERNYLRVFTGIALSSVVITLMGVLSMILYTLRLQRRGIAIRRVFGADYKSLCRYYLRGYVAAVLVAAAVALPVAWHLSARWLEGYDVRIAIGWLQPVTIVLGMLVVIGIIVAMQVWRAMREQPARVIQES